MPGVVQEYVERSEDESPRYSRLYYENGYDLDPNPDYRREHRVAIAQMERLLDYAKRTPEDRLQLDQLVWERHTRLLNSGADSVSAWTEAARAIKLERPAESETYDLGYSAMRQSLDRQFGEQSAWNFGPDDNRRLAHDLAINASQHVRRGFVPTGVDDRVDYGPELDRGMRKAIMDWSHERNYALRLESYELRHEMRMRI